MYRYSPPKSSIWGHSLRKMPPARERELLSKFLATAVAEYKFTNGILTISNDPFRATIQRFERLLGIAAKGNGFYSLTAQQCQQCLEEILRDDALTAGKTSSFSLLQGVAISKWRIHGQEIPTSSEITLYYGEHPCISTFLQFEDIGHFLFIRRVLEDLRLCKLSEKHLQPDKRKTAKPKS